MVVDAGIFFWLETSWSMTIDNFALSASNLASVEALCLMVRTVNLAVTSTDFRLDYASLIVVVEIVAAGSAAVAAAVAVKAWVAEELFSSLG